MTNPETIAETYLKARDELKTLRGQLEEARENNNSKVAELSELKKRVSALKEEIDDDESVREIKEKIKTTKEVMELNAEMIRIYLVEERQTLFEVGDISAFKLISKVKYLKNKDNE